MYALMHVHTRLSKYRAAVEQPGVRELQGQDQRGDRRYGGCVWRRPQVLLELDLDVGQGSDGGDAIGLVVASCMVVGLAGP